MTQRISDKELLELAAGWVGKASRDGMAAYDLLMLRAAVRRWIIAEELSIEECDPSGFYNEQAFMAAEALRAEMAGIDEDGGA